jgi:hypothetical protein
MRAREFILRQELSRDGGGTRTQSTPSNSDGVLPQSSRLHGSEASDHGDRRDAEHARKVGQHTRR